MDVLDVVLEEVRAGRVASKQDLHRAKMEAIRRLRVVAIPTDAELYQGLSPRDQDAYRSLFQVKPTRTLSGVAIIAVQTSPEWCPHGTCTYCPGGPTTYSAKSYTGFEPAALRAGRNNFDPYAQVADRLHNLHATGHETDKVDLILMGGTLTARDLDYQEWFVKRCYDALNDGETPTRNRLGVPGALTLEEAMRRNEESPNRCIGLTVETKPDWCFEPHLDVALGFGTTRIELGIQTTHEDVLVRVHRGHTLADSIHATQLVKDAGLKLVYHMMPGLPGSNPARDLESFRRIFEDPDFRPDMIKIYPTLVLPGTSLFEEWRRGAYEPYDTDTAADVIVEVKRFVPEWVRIQRVDRDIPVPMIGAGVDKSNLREIALERLGERYGQACRCIRCREVGLKGRVDGQKPDLEATRLKRVDYDASRGREIFLTVEDETHDLLIAYLRLRLPHNPHRPELAGASHGMIRELKVHGPTVGLGKKPREEWQHRGFGHLLLEEAARITFEEEGRENLFVLSGVGVKPYYRRLGFADDGVYLARTRSPKG